MNHDFVLLPDGRKMPAIGLGTWQAEDEEELKSTLSSAFQIGYKHIDTAYVYQNESIIGEVLKEWLDSGRITREELFITTKLPHFGLQPQRVEKYLKESLEKLQLDYVDLYLLHFPVCTKLGENCLPVFTETGDVVTEEADHLAVWKKMEDQVYAKRTKAIGLSNFNIKQTVKILNGARIKPANLQIEIHVYLQNRNLVNFCQRNGISVAAYTPLGNPGINAFFNKCGKPAKKLPNLLTDPVISEIALKHDRSNAQIALKYLLQRNICVLPKTVKENRLRENFDLFGFVLDAEDMKALNKLEMGEAGRICDWSYFFKGLENHPEWPFGS